jgi:hypothetical protein
LGWITVVGTFLLLLLRLLLFSHSPPLTNLIFFNRLLTVASIHRFLYGYSMAAHIEWARRSMLQSTDVDFAARLVSGAHQAGALVGASVALLVSILTPY